MLELRNIEFSKDKENDLLIEVFKAYTRNVFVYLNQKEVEKLYEFLKINFIKGGTKWKKRK